MIQYLPSKALLKGAISAFAFIVLFPILNHLAVIFALLPLLQPILNKNQDEQLTYTPIVASLIVFIVMGIKGGIFYAWFIAGPLMIFQRQAFLTITHNKNKLWYPGGNLLADYLVWNICGIVLLYFLVNQNDFNQEINLIISQLRQQYSQEKHVTTVDALSKIFLKLPHYHASLTLGMTMMWSLITFAMVQKKIIHKGNNKRPALKLIDLKLPEWCWYLLILTALGWLLLPVQTWYGFIAANSCLIMCFGFFLQGLSIVYAYAAHNKNKQMFLVIFYTVVILFTWLILLIVILGIFEPWLNLRQRLSERKD